MKKCLAVILFAVFLTPSFSIAETQCHLLVKVDTSYSDQGAFLKGVYRTISLGDRGHVDYPIALPIDSIYVVVDESKNSACIQTPSLDGKNFLVRVPSEPVKKLWDDALLAAKKAYDDHLLRQFYVAPTFKGKE